MLMGGFDLHEDFCLSFRPNPAVLGENHTFPGLLPGPLFTRVQYHPLNNLSGPRSFLANLKCLSQGESTKDDLVLLQSSFKLSCIPFPLFSRKTAWTWMWWSRSTSGIPSSATPSTPCTHHCSPCLMETSTSTVSPPPPPPAPPPTSWL